MDIRHGAKRFWRFLKKDTWQSWLVSLLLTFVFIKFIFFPLLSLITGTPLPLVVVESCSMYHSTPSFTQWWQQNEPWYGTKEINQSSFEGFDFTGGLNKGDIILVWGRSAPQVGDIIIFQAPLRYPVIHRVVSLDPLSTKGDNNGGQLDVEKDIQEDSVIGKAAFRIPGLGWLKLIFFEGLKPEDERGFCH